VRAEVLAEARRKSIHAVPGFLAYPIIVWLGRWPAAAISAFFLALYTLNELSLRGKLRVKVPVAYHTFRIMARRDEWEKGYFTGTVYFWALTLLTILALPPAEAAAAVMVSSLGDAAAALAGKLFGKPPLPYNRRKTLPGLAAMMAVSTASCLLAGLPPAKAFLASVAASLVESFTRTSVLDELTVPAAALVALWLLGTLSS
jgi:dolichol kinase